MEGLEFQAIDLGPPEGSRDLQGVWGNGNGGGRSLDHICLLERSLWLWGRRSGKVRPEARGPGRKPLLLRRWGGACCDLGGAGLGDREKEKT